MESFHVFPMFIQSSKTPFRTAFCSEKWWKLRWFVTQPQATRACRRWFILSKIPKWGYINWHWYASGMVDIYTVSKWQEVFFAYFWYKALKTFWKFKIVTLYTLDTWHRKRSCQTFLAHLSTSVFGRNRTRHSPYIQLSVVPRHLDLSSASPGNDDSLWRSLLLKGFEGCMYNSNQNKSLNLYYSKKTEKIMYTGIAQWGITTC